MPHLILADRLREAVVSILPDADTRVLQIQVCPDPKFGDYQTSGVMVLAKSLKRNPRQLATDVVANLKIDDLCEPAEIAGAGFINFRLRTTAIESALTKARGNMAALAGSSGHPRTFVVDFSSPNVAKPMHVGHIRSTILGDSIARTLRFLGHAVVTDNHLGDWGTQFGKLLVGWKHHLNAEELARDPMAEMERLYKLVNNACEADASTLTQARQELKKLQDGDEENLGIWKEMIRWSFCEFDRVYSRLGVQFDHTLGESFYNDRLRGVVSDLMSKDIARASEGATAVFFDGDPELKDHPALVQKSDGAANYTTTDLATVAYRIATWCPDEIIYVTDGRQQLHFKQLFKICERWIPAPRPTFNHVWFGSILGEDGKPFRTRAGETVRLTDLLNEAEERAFQVVTAKNPSLEESERREIARVVGIGAVKYADLLPNRQSDYVFSWEKMLSFNGNTAPYLQYAYARIRSIFRKSVEDPTGTGVEASAIRLMHPEELRLAKQLLNFGLVARAAGADCRPNYLCNYLYDLAGTFARFYEACPVLKAEAQDRASRLAICELTGDVLKAGLSLLGIETIERM